jgi:7,8-dihydro-6-hydroxymethylpterin-pyrophosphokinase
MLNQDTTIQHLKDTVFNVVIDIDTVIVKDTVIHTVNDTVLNPLLLMKLFVMGCS